jgi:hypothetical protein
VQEARLRKTIALKGSEESRTEFLAQLVKDIGAIRQTAQSQGMTPAVRLNGTSDEPWESVPVCVDGRDYANLMELFPDVRFYDYTKSAVRAERSIGLATLRHGWPPNYHLTYSRSEEPASERVADKILAGGGNVAVVFRYHADLERAIERGWHGFPVKDATVDDARFLDPPGTVAGLYAKRTSGSGGNAQLEQTGFVVDYPEEGRLRSRIPGVTDQDPGWSVPGVTRGFSLTARNQRSRYAGR